jgi:hypothetical protein
MLMTRNTGTAMGLAVMSCLAVAVPMQAQSTFDRLSVHGYLNQGYATSSDLPIHGIPTDGTVDYRSAALQFRYAFTPADNIVLQFRNRRMGTSALNGAQEDVHLEWAFYQRRFGNASFRIGKVPLASGLYNETRNVGAVVPFYRAPTSFYTEGVETLDGANVRYRLPLGRWDVEAHASIGDIRVVFPTFHPVTGAQILSTPDTDLAFSAGTMINTPLRGLRVGGAYTQFDGESLMGTGEMDPISIWTGSVDGTFDRFFVRGEYQELEWGDFGIDAYYAHGGVRVVPAVSLNAQYEIMDFVMTIPGMGTMTERSVRDAALGVNFFLSPNVVLKLEGHRMKGFSFDLPMAPGAPRGETDYIISSISVSF